MTKWRRERDSPGVPEARGFQRFRLENQCVSGTFGFQEPRGSMNLNSPAEERNGRNRVGYRPGSCRAIGRPAAAGGCARLDNGEGPVVTV